MRWNAREGAPRMAGIRCWVGLGLFGDNLLHITLPGATGNRDLPGGGRHPLPGKASCAAPPRVFVRSPMLLQTLEKPTFAPENRNDRAVKLGLGTQ